MNLWRLSLIALASIVVSACATAPQRLFVPETLASEAELPGLDDIRIWGDEPPAMLAKFVRREATVLRAKFDGRANSSVSNILVLTGGADDGAFGAGLLVGWSVRGNRPKFDLVTGISAGALIAPFAFLGSEFDPQLRAVFTSYTSEQIYQTELLTGLLGGNAIADSAPLAKLIETYVDQALLNRIAQERARGRMLLVGTTNLDAQRPVYWDMGRIAQSRHKDAPALFRKVLLASAAIPGVFPPVRFTVQAGGKTYEELHVDGGTTRNAFLSPSEFSFRQLDATLGVQVRRRLYVIRNGKLEPEYVPTKETAVVIAQRSLETVLKAQTLGDLLRIYDKARRDNIDYNLAAIPLSFKTPRPKPFDQAYMQSLFNLAYEQASKGYAWAKIPPGAVSMR
jgi:predicted acylesterase/phospholipase RssA